MSTVSVCKNTGYVEHPRSGDADTAGRIMAPAKAERRILEASVDAALEHAERAARRRLRTRQHSRSFELKVAGRTSAGGGLWPREL